VVELKAIIFSDKIIIVVGVVVFLLGAVAIIGAFPNSSTTTTSTRPQVTTSTTIQTSNVATATTTSTRASSLHTTATVTATTSQAPGPLLLEAKESVTSINANGGNFSCSSNGGCLEGNTVSWPFGETSPVLYGQDLVIRLTYDPLERVIYNSLAKAIAVRPQFDTTLAVNSSIPQTIPLSWGVKLGDEVTLDVYSETQTKLVAFVGVNLTSPDGLSIYSDFTPCSFSCIFLAGQSVQTNVDLVPPGFASVNVSSMSVMDAGISIGGIQPPLPATVSVFGTTFTVTLTLSQSDYVGYLDLNAS
jgi:hypothetical protein